MAEGFLRAFDEGLELYSAGTNPSDIVNPNAIKVMNELGIDISKNYPKSVDEFLSSEFDYVITVCGGAKESCPAFIGKVKNSVHIGFDDPVDAVGTEEEIIGEFRRVRNEILVDFFTFFNNNIKNKIINNK